MPDRGRFRELQTSIPAACSPTFGIQPGHADTFPVGTFRPTDGKETWHFGDGRPKVMVLSDADFVEPAMDCYARAVDAFEEPGRYLVRVEEAYRRGYTAAADVHVRVGVVSPRRNGQPVRPSSTHGPGYFVLSP